MCSHSCLPVCPCWSKTSPAAGGQGVKKHLHNGSQWSKMRGLHRIIWSHSGVICKLSQQDMPLLTVTHPCSLAQLYRKQINCSNWGFDLVFCESGQRTLTAFHYMLWRWLRLRHKSVTHIVGKLIHCDSRTEKSQREPALSHLNSVCKTVQKAVLEGYISVTKK